MKNRRLFVGREKEMEQLRHAYAERRSIMIVGPAGIGKTALLRQARQYFPLLLCEETSSLRRICENLEQQLGWTHRSLHLVQRKNRLLLYLVQRGQLVAFDGVALTPPRVARFIAHLTERIPIWIACRSTQPKEIGAVWQHLYNFTRLELGPLSLRETTILIEAAINASRVQKDACRHSAKLHRIVGGNPRALEELFIELAARKYVMDSAFGLNLLKLDRRIHKVTTETAEILGPNP
jgi:hypothetical protein